MTDFDYSRTINGNDQFRVQQSVNPTVPQFEGDNLSDAARGLLSGGNGVSVQGSMGRAQATTRDVGRNELVQNQLAGLLNQNNPYISRARRAAADQSASRGLANSSIAAGNAEGAAIDRAMPIAAQDASTYGRTASENMAAQNAMEQANLQSGTSILQSKIGAGASLGAARMGLQGRLLGYENALEQQARGAEIQAYNDARRQAYNMENRQSGINWRFGQSHELDRDRFGEGQRQFNQNFGEGQRQFDQRLGENQRQYNLGYGLDNRRTDIDAMLRARGQDASLIGQQGIAASNAVSAAASNPNLTAEQQQAAMNSASSSINNQFSMASGLPQFNLPPLPSFNFNGGGGNFGGGYGYPPYGGYNGG